jgi:ABC-type spermidine/putrescine transport system permease subunit II
MENTFQSNWRVVALPLILTAIVVGSALGFIFS